MFCYTMSSQMCFGSSFAGTIIAWKNYYPAGTVMCEIIWKLLNLNQDRLQDLVWMGLLVLNYVKYQLIVINAT